MMAPQYIRTSVLEIAYEAHGPAHGQAVVLLHGFPYDPRSFDGVVTILNTAGMRTVVPYVRGYGGTQAPEPIDQYTLMHLTGDMVGVLLGAQDVHVLVGLLHRAGDEIKLVYVPHRRAAR